MAAQIYLADQRGQLTTPQHQRLSTLNFGAYAAEGRAPFGRLRALNEERLASGQPVLLPVAEAVLLVLLPIEGAVQYQAAGLSGTADVEQVLVLTLPAGSTVTLRNPYPDAIITVLHLWLAADNPAPAAAQSFAYSFGQLENTLVELVPLGPLPFGLHLGRFAGRHEAAHAGQAPGNLVFAFVLAGAFELQNCLLHAGDGLGLRHCPTVELEALSNEALVLLLELAA